MNKTRTLRHLKSWLKENRKRFFVRPYIMKVNSKGIWLTYNRLDGIIMVKIENSNYLSVWGFLKNTKRKYPWEWFADIESTNVKKGKKLSREELFESLLHWSNMNLVPGNRIIYYDFGGWGEGGIVSQNERLKNSEKFSIIESHEIL